MTIRLIHIGELRMKRILDRANLTVAKSDSKARTIAGE
ncbi:hypothetical protein VN12_05385 [Pirellula sp. SH-Sr6A]|nr:hypothetical protein VN12_05385 [Pirellula sp. SH-Sr6A]